MIGNFQASKRSCSLLLWRVAGLLLLRCCTRSAYAKKKHNSSRPAMHHKSSNSERLRLLAWSSRVFFKFEFSKWTQYLIATAMTMWNYCEVAVSERYFQRLVVPKLEIAIWFDELFCETIILLFLLNCPWLLFWKCAFKKLFQAKHAFYTPGLDENRGSSDFAHDIWICFKVQCTGSNSKIVTPLSNFRKIALIQSKW